MYVLHKKLHYISLRVALLYVVIGWTVHICLHAMQGGQSKHKEDVV